MILDSKTITDHKVSELSLIFLPGFIVLFCLWGYPDLLGGHLWLIALAYYFTDAGHVFTTLLRFDFKSKTEYKEVLYPFIICTVFFFTSFAFAIKEVWYLIVYLTFIHNLKQAYGISAWYRSIANEKRKKFNFFKILFYLINLVAFFAIHLRPNPGAIKEYPLVYIFRFENLSLYQSSLFCYGVFLLCLLYERAKNAGSIQAFCYPFVMCGVYFIALIMSENSNQILIPLILTHGLAYMAIIRHSSQRLFNVGRLFPLIFLALFGGVVYWLFLEEMIFLSISPFFHHFSRAMIFGAIFTHYYIDGIIWRHDHHQIAQINATVGHSK